MTVGVVLSGRCDVGDHAACRFSPHLRRGAKCQCACHWPYESFKHLARDVHRAVVREATGRQARIEDLLG